MILSKLGLRRSWSRYEPGTVDDAWVVQGLPGREALAVGNIGEFAFLSILISRAVF